MTTNPNRSSPRVAIYPGSFDPPTLGHLDIIERAAALFDRVVVGVLVNPSKRALLDRDRRAELLEAEIAERFLATVEVRGFDGLTVDFAASVGAGWAVRGVRSAADLGSETAMAETNHRASPTGLETIFLPARTELAFIASRLVREIARGGGQLDGLVSLRVAAALRESMGK